MSLFQVVGAILLMVGSFLVLYAIALADSRVRPARWRTRGPRLVLSGRGEKVSETRRSGWREAA